MFSATMLALHASNAACTHRSKLRTAFHQRHQSVVSNAEIVGARKAAQAWAALGKGNYADVGDAANVAQRERTKQRHVPANAHQREVSNPVAL
jgi:hypothetical protein